MTTEKNITPFITQGTADTPAISFIPNNLYFNISGIATSTFSFGEGIRRTDEVEIIELKADSLPIGNLFGTKFLLKKETLSPSDMVYLFSDGYKDQKGGSQNKRLFIGPFKEMLAGVAQSGCLEQKEIIFKKLNEWKGNQEQIDDICIMGIRV